MVLGGKEAKEMEALGRRIWKSPKGCGWCEEEERVWASAVEAVQPHAYFV